VEAADCYLVVTPEYNHSIPSPLVNMMNIFGSSKYANKVSGTVCYSSTPIGGPRVAYALLPCVFFRFLLLDICRARVCACVRGSLVLVLVVGFLLHF
jgi:NAD(P)H-dependent FMN reductase